MKSAIGLCTFLFICTFNGPQCNKFYFCSSILFNAKGVNEIGMEFYL